MVQFQRCLLQGLLEGEPDRHRALRARMDSLVPLWSEYKKLVAVAG